MKKKSIIFAVDMGGTNWKMALMEGGHPLVLRHAPNTRQLGDLEALPGHLSTMLGELGAGQDECLGMGISLPEIVNRSSGECPANCPKHPYFTGKNMKDVVRSYLGLSVAVDNDARCALLGEEHYGVLRDLPQPAANALMITLGTGIGVGARVEGNLLRGSHHAGSILGGHITLDINGPPCPCGNRGCAEALASGWALEQRMPKEDWYRSSSLAALPKADFKALVDAVRGGDSGARIGLQKFREVWESLLVSLCHLLDPRVIVLSGGFVYAADLFLGDLKEGLRGRLWNASHCPDLLIAKEPELSGLRGAEALARDDFDE